MLRRTRAVLVAALSALAAVVGSHQGLQAQMYSNNAYLPVPWPKPWGPDGLNGSIDFGPTTAIFGDPNGDFIWVANRCGRTPLYHSSNESCTYKPDYDMIFKFDLDGNLVQRFGRGTLAKPHSMWVDKAGNVYIADEGGGATYGHTAAETDAENRRLGIAQQVVKYDGKTGKVLMRFGTPGVEGSDDTHFNHPVSVSVSERDGSVFIYDSHNGTKNRRLMKFSAAGKFIKEIGCRDCAAQRVENTAWNKFADVHAMAMDSKGNLYAADKVNFRVAIYDQDLNLLDIWTQFGAPAGIAIDPTTNFMVTSDAESGITQALDGDPDNTGWQQGLYIGSARTGWVKNFVLSLAPAVAGGDGGPEGVAVDRYGNIYWAETRSALDIRRGQHVMKYVDMTRTPGVTCEWWGYPAERAGRTGDNGSAMTGCGIDKASRTAPEPQR